MPRPLTIVAAVVLTVVAVAMAAPMFAAPKASKAPVSLCPAGADVFFSCQAKSQKSINLCREPGKPVAYRFGTPEKLELSYPKTQDDPPLHYAHYGRAQTERMEVTFSSGGAEYAVFDYEEDGRREAGVRATLADGREITIACKGTIASRLGELERVLPCDADNALNLDGCPKAAP